MQVSTIGIDLAKNVFQVHGVDAGGKVVIAKKLRRSQVLPLFAKLPPCLVGMEACATSHHWARELKALGHDVRLMPAELREGLRQAQQERCRRCGRYLRSGEPAEHAVCSRQDYRAASHIDAASNARFAGASAHAADQCNASASGRVRPDRRARARRAYDLDRHHEERGFHSGMARKALHGLLGQWMRLACRSATSNDSSLLSIDRTTRVGVYRRYQALV